MPPADLCPHGCYWDCEHRAPPALEGGLDAAVPRAVHDDEGRPLRRCQVCGQTFYSTVAHARDHQRMRQLGLLPDPSPYGIR